MPADAAQVVKRGSDLFNRREIDAMIDQLRHPDAVLSIIGRSPGSQWIGRAFAS
jgi:hypothetical protein